MNDPNLPPPLQLARQVAQGATALAAVVMSLWLAPVSLGAPDNDDQGVEVLTRGPVHEAFASVVTYNSEPSVVVKEAPPEPIEEVPPAERPEGDHVSWIPGYWSWDDERSDFIWLSGTWRALPPDREWVPGYWAKVSDGHQWASGYWANVSTNETVYLPAPPKTQERGPNTDAPSADQIWVPGNWIWREERYAWTPGYWTAGRPDWDWIPANYVWTPRGYVFVDGYWDYTVQRRGVVFAPTYIESGVYSRRGYTYSPSIALDVAMLVEHLFLRPQYHHYYFGDYYEPRYRQRGFYSTFTYQQDHYGYDPIFTHMRWQHRDDRDWDRRYMQSYEYRREHEDARPPRTWAAMQKLDVDSELARNNRLMVASKFDDLAKRKDSNLKLRPVAQEERQQLTQRSKQVQQFRQERRNLEAEKGEATGTGDNARVSRAKLPKSTIAGEPASRLKGDQAPPKAPRAGEQDNQPRTTERDRGETPGDRTAEKPGSRPGETPGDRTAEKPGSRPGETPGDRTGEAPGSRRGETPGDRSGEAPGSRRGEAPGDRSGEAPGSRRGESPGDRSGEAPGSRRGESPDDRSGEAPGSRRGETPGDRSGEKPGSRRGESPGDRSGEAPKGESSRRGETPGDRSGEAPKGERSRRGGDSSNDASKRDERRKDKE